MACDGSRHLPTRPWVVHGSGSLGLGPGGDGETREPEKRHATDLYIDVIAVLTLDVYHLLM
jgi:hypothetical protein